MTKIINFSQAKQSKIRYYITIDENETPTYITKQLRPGVIGVMVTAGTLEEAGMLCRESTAIVRATIA